MMDSDDEALVALMANDIDSHRVRNKVKSEYYQGARKPPQPGLIIPPKLRDWAPRLGWAGIVVDALEERLNFLGWRAPGGDLGLGDVFDVNQLEVEASLAHLDALIFGTAFVTVGRGADGEPDPLVTVTSTMDTTGLWDGRARRLEAAFSLDPKPRPGDPESGRLYLPGATVQVEKRSGRWAEVDRDEHGLGRVPVVMMPNRTSASMLLGHSEISKPVRDLVDEAARVLLSMRVNREFFSAPQRLVLGPAPEDLDHWKALTTGLLVAEADANGELPQIDTFPAVSPGPHIEQLKALAAQLAAVAGVPEVYFGVAPSVNPASADAIRAAEARLVKKAERRQSMFGAAWLQVAELALLLRDGEVPEEFRRVSCHWRDAATPTRAAEADAAAKLVGSGIIPARSQVTYDKVGLTPSEQEQVQADWDLYPSATELLARAVV